MMSSDPPVNLFFNAPTENDDLWRNLGRDGHTGFWPVTIKAFYLYGLLLSIFRSTEILIRNSKTNLGGREFHGNFARYLTAFGVFASGVELFGRCLGGITEAEGQATRCLSIGFNWLANPGSTDDNRELTIITTPRSPYTVRELVNLRNFTAHGQATTARNDSFLDFELLPPFPRMIGIAIESWWSQVTTQHRELCINLGRASLLPVNLQQPIVQTMLTFSIQAAGNHFFELDFS
jgi:hypothetical protein